jgi:hypothetical protein
VPRAGAFERRIIVPRPSDRTRTIVDDAKLEPIPARPACAAHDMVIGAGVRLPSLTHK